MRGRGEGMIDEAASLQLVLLVVKAGGLARKLGLPAPSPPKKLSVRYGDILWRTRGTTFSHIPGRELP